MFREEVTSEDRGLDQGINNGFLIALLVTGNQRKAEAAGAAGDEDDLAGATFCGARHESVDGCGGDDAGGDLRGLECDSGLLHASLRCRNLANYFYTSVV